MTNAFYWTQRAQRLNPPPPVPLSEQEVQRALARKYYWANHETKLKKQAQFRKDRPEVWHTWYLRNYAKLRTYRLAHMDRFNKASMKYYAAHRDERLAYMRAYRAAKKAQRATPASSV